MTEGMGICPISTIPTNGSTNQLFSQLEAAFVCASMIAERQAPHEGLLSHAASKRFTKLRADGAAVIVESVLSAQRRLSSPSSRIVGTLLKEALLWDTNVVVPEELKKAQSKVPAPLRCGACGISNPSNRCPCGNAHYCSKACQAKAWKKHKSDCTFRKEGKGKK
jgi:hypothetical protein